jgi:hypothetical protein
MTSPSMRRRQTPGWLLSLVFLVMLFPALACAAGGSGSAPKAVEHRKFLVLLCQMAGATSVPQNISYYQDLFTKNDPKLQNVYKYFVDESYGSIDIAGTVIQDWLLTGEDQKTLEALRPADHPNYWRTSLSQHCANDFKASGRVTDFTPFARGGIITIWNLEGADGGASGITLDGKDYPSVNAGAGFNAGENAVSFFTHEMLHNLGVDHAHGPFPDGWQVQKLDAHNVDAGDTHTFGANGYTEYGDCWTIMGCGRWTTDAWGQFGEKGPDLGAAQRATLGWMPADRTLVWGHDVTLKVDLVPANRPDIPGTMLVKIPFSVDVGVVHVDAMYTVEYIERTGWSAGIGLEHAVLIHEVWGNDPKHTRLVSRTLFGAWLPGQVFLDPALGVRISIDSYGPTAQITIGGSGPGDGGVPVCLPPVSDNPGHPYDTTYLPSVTIQAPLPDAHAVAGIPVTLQVVATDPYLMTTPPVPDPVPDDRIHWTAVSPSLGTTGSAALGTRSSLLHTFATPGDYTIEVSAYDQYCGITSKSVILHVDPPSATGNAVILQPVDGQEYLVGAPSFSQTISLAASGSANIVAYNWLDNGDWIADGDHASANIKLSSSARNCVAEPHKITLRTKTSSGDIVDSSITITLKTNCIR